MNIVGTLRDYPQWIAGSEMPVWFWPAMWIYLLICVLSLLASFFFKDDYFKWGKKKILYGSVSGWAHWLRIHRVRHRASVGDLDYGPPVWRSKASRGSVHQHG